MNNILLAVNICTYHRKEFIENNINKLLSLSFFDKCDERLFGRMHIFVTDNGSEISVVNDEFLHIVHNRNNGGSGGFQRGLEEIRKSGIEFSHVIFMDDDVKFEDDLFYILYDFLCNVSDEYKDNPVAGRMLCMDKPDIQYTAAEVWNSGDIRHIEYMRDISGDDYEKGRVVYNSGAEYGGWWFCCYPMKFATDNDVIPFFIHCDDVEYGLRCGSPPIIIEGVHVWHDTFVNRTTPLIKYYDLRNTLFVNEMHQCGAAPDDILTQWKQKISMSHMEKDYKSEYYLIKALNDYLRGTDWLYKIDSEKYHHNLEKKHTNRFFNSFFWRFVQYKFKKKYNI